MTCIYCNDTPGVRENCYCRDTTVQSNIFDRIATRIFEANANTNADAVAICINEAGLNALCADERIGQQGGNRANIASQTFHGLPFKILPDRPKDKFHDHWRFYLEFKSR